MKESDTNPDETRKRNRKMESNQKNIKKVNVRWAVKILIWSFALSMAFTAVSDRTLKHFGYLVAFSVLGCIILIGVVFDILGVAATAAAEKPFHAMASRHVSGARQAIWLVRNADKVSNFCNDVVGDICGIISGSTAAVIIARFQFELPLLQFSFPLIVTGLVAGLTVGGKALGKGFAIRYANKIIYSVGRFLNIFKR